MVLDVVVQDAERAQPDIRRRSSHVLPGRRASQLNDGELPDTDSSGKKDNEVIHINSHGQGCVPLSLFPEKTATKLKALDEDNTGTVPTMKLEHAIEALAREKSYSRFLCYGLVVLAIFAAVTLVSVCGMTYYVIEVSKDMRMGTDSVLITSTSGDPVKVASADFQVRDNSLVPRDCKDGTCSPLGVSLSAYKTPLSSQLPDETLAGLASMTIRGDGALLHLTISAFARFADESRNQGSVVVLYTPLGDISLRGDELSFDSSTSNAFDRAGFIVDASRRRLLAKPSLEGVVTGQGPASRQTPIAAATQKEKPKERPGCFRWCRVSKQLTSALASTPTYPAGGDLELERTTSELLDEVMEELRIRKRPDVLTGEWDELVDSSLDLLQENPLATDGGRRNSFPALGASQSGAEDGLKEIIDNVYRMSALARTFRKTMRRAKIKRRIRRSDNGARALLQLTEGMGIEGEAVIPECKPSLTEEEMMKLESTLDIAPPLKAVEALASGMQQAEKLGEEDIRVVASELIRLLEGRHAIMQPAAIADLEKELESSGLLQEAAKLGWAGEALRPLLAIYERILDLVDDPVYWIELARDARREGGGYVSSSPTTIKGSSIALNPRLAPDDGLAMAFEVKSKAWKKDTDSGCGAGSTCPCDLNSERGICLFNGKRRADEQPQECSCEWVEADLDAREDPEWLTILTTMTVTSQRKGQPLRSLAQDIRVEVQVMKNSDRRRGLPEQDGIHMATYSIIASKTTAASTYKKGDRISLVGFGTFSTSSGAQSGGSRGRRRDPRDGFDHVGAYNFMVELSLPRIDWGTGGGAGCADTDETLDAYLYSEDEALKLGQRIRQPDSSAGDGLDQTGCLLYGGLEPSYLSLIESEISQPQKEEVPKPVPEEISQPESENKEQIAKPEERPVEEPTLP